MMAAGRERLAARLNACSAKGRLALVVYITCGYPSPEATVQVCRALAAVGVDAIELGVPFSDPLADGPTIQRSSALALRHGVTVRTCLEMARQVRAEVGPEVGVLFMSYWNPLFQYGFERFLQDAAASGADGFILPDMPLEELCALVPLAEAEGLAIVPLLAPNTPLERARLVRHMAPPFVYVTTRLGVTGARADLPQALRQVLAMLRPVVEVPLAVGFGISRREHVRALWGYADAAVVGSALLDRLGSGGDPAEAAAAFCRELLDGCTKA